MRPRSLAASAFTATLLVSASAPATYSLVAVDARTGQVGAAGASCVPYEVIRIYGVAPGRGAVVAQAYFDDPALADAVQRLGEGEGAADVLASVTDPAAHPLAPRMQWGIVDAEGGVAHATGPEAKPFADDREGGVTTFGLAVQGNLLTSSNVLEHAIAGFEGSGCDLADRLVRGLEAARAGGEGDGRCTPDGIPARSAFVDVSGGSGSLLRISVPDVSPDDPVAALREAFDGWRSEHPCPEGSSAPEPVAGAEAPDDGGSCTLRPTRRTPDVPGGLLVGVALLGLAGWSRKLRGRGRRSWRAGLAGCLAATGCDTSKPPSPSPPPPATATASAAPNGAPTLAECEALLASYRPFAPELLRDDEGFIARCRGSDRAVLGCIERAGKGCPAEEGGPRNTCITLEGAACVQRQRTAAARREGIPERVGRGVLDGTRAPDESGVLVLPPDAATSARGGKAMAVVLPDKRAWVFFPIWRGRCRNVRGFLWSSAPFTEGDFQKGAAGDVIPALALRLPDPCGPPPDLRPPGPPPIPGEPFAVEERLDPQWIAVAWTYD